MIVPFIHWQNRCAKLRSNQLIYLIWKWCTMSMPVINPTYTWKKSLSYSTQKQLDKTRQSRLYLHLHGQYENTMNEIPREVRSWYYSRNKDPDSEACWSAVQEIRTSERASVSPAAGQRISAAALFLCPAVSGRPLSGPGDKWCRIENSRNL